MLKVKENIQESVFRIIANSGLKQVDLENLLADFDKTMGASLEGSTDDTIGIAFIAFSLGHLNTMSPGSNFNRNFGGRAEKKVT